MASKRIAVVGGGPGGLMLARLLQLRGLSPIVFERDEHAGDRPQGGSLDLHGETGQRAMHLARLEREFEKSARPEDQGDRLYDADGALLYDRDGHGDDRPEIDRTALRQILLDSLAPGTVRWGAKIEKIAPTSAGVELTGKGWREDADVIVGADGAWSKVRPLLSKKTPVYEGVTLVELDFDIAGFPEIAALTGDGKMFAVGDNRALITQKNGLDRIRGYAGARLSEQTAREWSEQSPAMVRAALLNAFAGWAPALTRVIEGGEFVAVRPLYALPIGHSWESRPGMTMLGDAAHLMSPFSGEGVNLALADAVDLAEAMIGHDGWHAVTQAEDKISKRAAIAAAGAAEGLQGAFSPAGVAPVLEHYRERTSE